MEFLNGVKQKCKPSTPQLYSPSLHAPDKGPSLVSRQHAPDNAPPTPALISRQHAPDNTDLQAACPSPSHISKQHAPDNSPPCTAYPRFGPTPALISRLHMIPQRIATLSQKEKEKAILYITIVIQPYSQLSQLPNYILKEEIGCMESALAWNQPQHGALQLQFAASGGTSLCG